MNGAFRIDTVLCGRDLSYRAGDDAVDAFGREVERLARSLASAVIDSGQTFGYDLVITLRVADANVVTTEPGSRL